MDVCSSFLKCLERIERERERERERENMNFTIFLLFFSLIFFFFFSYFVFVFSIGLSHLSGCLLNQGQFGTPAKSARRIPPP